MQRKPAAILAADVVGYSRLIRADGAGTLALMKTLWREIVKPTIREHRGRVFKLMGDGLLAEFPSVVDAAAAATAIQTEVNERAVAEPEPRRIQLRIGINLGDVVVDGSDLYGDGVNLAARLQEIAEPGGVAVSDSTYENLRGTCNPRNSAEPRDEGCAGCQQDNALARHQTETPNRRPEP